MVTVLGLFKKTKTKVHQKVKDWQKDRTESKLKNKEIHKIRKKAEWKGRIARAKQEGYRDGLKGKPSRLKKASDMMNDMTNLIGGGYEPGFVQKKKKKKDPLWDLI